MIFLTEIRAYKAGTDEIRKYAGDRVEAPSRELAQEWCDENKPYLKVIGRLSLEIIGNETIDYDLPLNN
jgi:hypothetical protein